MNDIGYRVLKDKGDLGESFFYERHNELLNNPVAILKDMRDWKIEGSDFGAERFRLTPIKGLEGGIDSDYVQMGILSTYSAYRPETQYGGVEIKNVGTDQFLPRYGNGIEKWMQGSLGFSMWSGLKDLPDGKVVYLRSGHGNLRRWMEPSVDNRGARPMILAFLLATCVIDISTGNMSERFFASIVFEDFEALIERLTGYAAQHGLDLCDWDQSVPIGEEAQHFEVSGLIFQGNMWHVPLNELGDLPTVTIIGKDPEIYPTGWCSAETQYSRLEYLKLLANGRRISQDKEINREIPDDQALRELWHNRMFIGTRYPDQRDINGKSVSP